MLEIGPGTHLAASLLSLGDRGTLLLRFRSSFGRSLLGILRSLCGSALCGLLSILFSLGSSALCSLSLLSNRLLGSFLRVFHSLGGISLSLLLGGLRRLLSLLALREDVLVFGLSSSTPVSLLGPMCFARGAVQGLLTT